MSTVPVLNTEGIVLRRIVSWESSKYERFKAHKDTCRYATGDCYPIQQQTQVVGFSTQRVLTMAIAGSIEACKVCKPQLIEYRHGSGR